MSGRVDLVSVVHSWHTRVLQKQLMLRYYHVCCCELLLRSGADNQMPARLNAVRLLDGRSSFGSTLSSVGTPSTRQQDLSASDWPINRCALESAGGCNMIESRFECVQTVMDEAAAA